MTRTPKTAAPKAPTVKVGGVISDGCGGYLPKGATIEGASKETLASLRAKGLID